LLSTTGRDSFGAIFSQNESYKISQASSSSITAQNNLEAVVRLWVQFFSNSGTKNASCSANLNFIVGRFFPINACMCGGQNFYYPRRLLGAVRHRGIKIISQQSRIQGLGLHCHMGNFSIIYADIQQAQKILHTYIKISTIIIGGKNILQ
jgi:hypothetical protein